MFVLYVLSARQFINVWDVGWGTELFYTSGTFDGACDYLKQMYIESCKYVCSGYHICEYILCNEFPTF